MSAVAQEFCGVVRYYGMEFDVQWNKGNRTVLVTSKYNRLAIEFGNEYKAENRREALEVAQKMLKDKLWG